MHIDMLIICFQDTIYINNKAKVVFSDLESSNGIFHEIDTVLVPPGFQMQKDREQESTPVCSRKHEIMKLHYEFFYFVIVFFSFWKRNLSDVVSLHGFKTFFKLLEVKNEQKYVFLSNKILSTKKSV